VTQLEIMPQPPEHENKYMVWPHWPLKMRTSSSQAEGADRDWSVMTTRLTGKNGKLQKLHCVRVDDDMKPVEGSDFALKAELVLLAMGFVHPAHEGMIEALKLELDPRGNVLADEIGYQTSREKIFAAGDMRRGQSLVVWAIHEGRQCAAAVDDYLRSDSV
jgi:glutamate synthase (NADPH/NADH) small chain